MNYEPQPVIKTERLLLRHLKPEDAPVLYQIRSNPDVNKYLIRKPAESIQEAEEFITRITESIKNRESCYWAICFMEEKVICGTICLFHFSKEKNSCEAGYELSPEYHGKGIMQEAIKPVLEHGFQNLKFSFIEAVVDPANAASIRLLEKNGFIKSEETSPSDHLYKKKSKSHAETQ